MFDPCFVMRYLVSFLVLQSSRFIFIFCYCIVCVWGGGALCLVFVTSLCSFCRGPVSVLCLFLAAPWVGQWYVIVIAAFLGHTIAIFGTYCID